MPWLVFLCHLSNCEGIVLFLETSRETLDMMKGAVEEGSQGKPSPTVDVLHHFVCSADWNEMTHISFK